MYLSTIMIIIIYNHSKYTTRGYTETRCYAVSTLNSVNEKKSVRRVNNLKTNILVMQCNTCMTNVSNRSEST